MIIQLNNVSKFVRYPIDGGIDPLKLLHVRSLYIYYHKKLKWTENGEKE